MLLSIYFEILKDLYSSPKGQRIYCFYSKYNVPISELANALLLFKDAKYITIENNNFAILTEEGRKWVFLNRKELFLKNRYQYWKKIRTEDLMNEQELVETEKLYIPNIKKIDKQLFENEKDKRNEKKI